MSGTGYCIKCPRIFVQYGTLKPEEWAVKIWEAEPDSFAAKRSSSDSKKYWEMIRCPSSMYEIKFDSYRTTVLRINAIETRINSLMLNPVPYDISVEKHIYRRLCVFSKRVPNTFKLNDFTLKSITFPWDKVKV